jgi:hypothetical protein
MTAPNEAEPASKLRIPAACNAMSVRDPSTPLPFATL